MMNKHSTAFAAFGRNKRWGTCAACPRSTDGSVFPEFCEYTDRYDHQLDINQLRAAFLRGAFDA